MPWKETSAMDQRLQLIADWLSGDYTKRELCRIYEISRPTTDKWIARYRARGVQGLEELARAPHSHPNQPAEELRLMIVAEKLQHQQWGPKKVMDRLRREQPHVAWPADSTAGEILKRVGLVRPRVRRRRVAHTPNHFATARAQIRSGAPTSKGIFAWAMGAAAIH